MWSYVLRRHDEQTFELRFNGYNVLTTMPGDVDLPEVADAVLLAKEGTVLEPDAVSCSGVAISFVTLQEWSFHKWYRYTTARQYRSLMTNSGTPSFFVGMQDIGPHEIS